MARGTQHQPGDDAAERHDAETRLYEPVQQTPPDDPVPEPTPTFAAPPYATNVNVASGTSADPAAQRALAAARLNAVLMWLFAVIDVLLALRFVLKAAAANSSASFTTVIYGLTDPLASPFIGVVATVQFGASVFEFPDLLAILIYFLVSLLLTRLIRILFIDQPRLR